MEILKELTKLKELEAKNKTLIEKGEQRKKKEQKKLLKEIKGTKKKLDKVKKNEWPGAVEDKEKEFDKLEKKIDHIKVKLKKINQIDWSLKENNVEKDVSQQKKKSPFRSSLGNEGIQANKTVVTRVVKDKFKEFFFEYNDLENKQIVSRKPIVKTKVLNIPKRDGNDKTLSPAEDDLKVLESEHKNKTKSREIPKEEEGTKDTFDGDDWEVLESDPKDENKAGDIPKEGEEGKNETFAGDDWEVLESEHKNKTEARKIPKEGEHKNETSASDDWKVFESENKTKAGGIPKEEEGTNENFASDDWEVLESEPKNKTNAGEIPKGEEGSHENFAGDDWEVLEREPKNKTIAGDIPKEEGGNNETYAEDDLEMLDSEPKSTMTERKGPGIHQPNRSAGFALNHLDHRKRNSPKDMDGKEGGGQDEPTNPGKDINTNATSPGEKEGNPQPNGDILSPCNSEDCDSDLLVQALLRPAQDETGNPEAELTTAPTLSKEPDTRHETFTEKQEHMPEETSQGENNHCLKFCQDPPCPPNEWQYIC